MHLRPDRWVDTTSMIDIGSFEPLNLSIHLGKRVHHIWFMLPYGSEMRLCENDMDVEAPKPAFLWTPHLNFPRLIATTSTIPASASPPWASGVPHTGEHSASTRRSWPCPTADAGCPSWGDPVDSRLPRAHWAWIWSWIEPVLSRDGFGGLLAVVWGVRSSVAVSTLAWLSCLPGACCSSLSAWRRAGDLQGLRKRGGCASLALEPKPAGWSADGSMTTGSDWWWALGGIGRGLAREEASACCKLSDIFWEALRSSQLLMTRSTSLRSHATCPPWAAAGTKRAGQGSVGQHSGLCF